MGPREFRNHWLDGALSLVESKVARAGDTHIFTEVYSRFGNLYLVEYPVDSTRHGLKDLHFYRFPTRVQKNPDDTYSIME